MKVLGFRFCQVSPEAPKLASFLDAIGFERHPLEDGGTNANDPSAGAVFSAGESWLAMWPPSADMPAGMMLQVVVDDADAFAARAREQGLNPVGPSDSKTKRLYFLQAPTGLQMSIQSRLPGQREQSVPAPPPAPVRTKSLAPPPLVAPPNNRGPLSPIASGHTPSAAPPPVAVAPSAAPPPVAVAASSAPPATAAKRIQTVVLPPVTPGAAPTAARRTGPLPTGPRFAQKSAAPPPPPIVNRRAPR